MKPLLAAVSLAVFAPMCIAAPATPGESCLRIAADLEHAQEARKEAVDKGDNAWKAVVPFAVIARKASSKAALDEADKQIATLRRQAEAEGCSDAR